MAKRSFFERLTGSINLENEDELFKNNEKENNIFENYGKESQEYDAETAAFRSAKKIKESEEEGQLTIDAYKNSNSIIIQSFMAGVKPDDLDVTITRDMVTIKGKRIKSNSASSSDYIYEELYWGTFSRSIVLPEEIDVDNSEASFSKSGVLTITLPKIDKNKVQRIKVKND